MASAYLYRTLGTPTNAYKGTLSWWQKGMNTSSSQYILACESGSERQLWYGTSGKFQGGLRGTSSPPDIDFSLSGTPRFRDTSGWYHCVLAWDSTQGTGSDRYKYYVNGVEFTISGSGSSSTIPQNHVMPMNKSGLPFRIGSTISGGSYFEGIMSHIHFCDGTQYQASDFGETDATTGIWKAKTSPSVTYGNNGFFLKMDNSGNMGLDSSGNSNNLTTNGTIIQTKDTPSNVFATLNALDNYYCSGTFSNGSNTIVTGSSETAYVRGTLGATQGKWYYEAKAVATSNSNSWYSIGWSGNSATGTTVALGNQSDAVSYQGQNGTIRINGSETSTGTTYTTGDIIGTALDLDNNLVYFYKNGTLVNSGGTSITASASTTNGVWCPAIGDIDTTGTKTWSINFGNGYFGTTAVSSAQNPDDGIGIFEYDVPAGYRALCTKSINAEEYS